ncbi:MAG: formate dehydrogenase subunit gamma [Burkholderiales bacterium]|nr:formate dehydrogenase subunit gamma [Burkholderiales bacterium]
MRNDLIAVARSLVLLAGLAWVGIAAAQSPALNPQQAEQAKQQVMQQRVQPLNNQPVWSAVRSGEPQITGVRGRETNVLIQPEGQTWRAARVPLAAVGGFLFALTLVAIAVFYVWRGPISLKSPPTGRMIERFTLVERAVHWGVAITFVTLALTGLVVTFGKAVLLPLIGYTLFSWLATLSKWLHNFVGLVLVVLLPIMIVMFLRTNLFRAYDWTWLKKAGGMFSRTHVPAGKANAGQKLLFWLMVVASGITLCVTGLILDFPNFDQTRQTMQITNIVHMVAAMVGTILVAGHIYLGTIGMRGALDAMRTGYVDETWAKEHHEYWYNEVKSGKSAGEGAVPLAAQHRTV